jgi:hypothetical protein
LALEQEVQPAPLVLQDRKDYREMLAHQDLQELDLPDHKVFKDQQVQLGQQAREE